MGHKGLTRYHGYVFFFIERTGAVGGGVEGAGDAGASVSSPVLSYG